MKITDCKNIVGRGTVLITEYKSNVKCGDTIKIEENEYKIIGLELFSNYYTKYMGVVIGGVHDDPFYFIGKEICYI